MTFAYAGRFLTFTHTFFVHSVLWPLWYFKQVYFQLKICLFYVCILNNHKITK
jgi:hypothetical protein